MADGRHIENRFWLYLGAILADQREIWNRNEGSHADIGHVSKTAIFFANARWRTAAILKIALSPYLSRELSDFDQIWLTDTSFHSEHAKLTKKSKIFKLKMADGRHIENDFLAISRRHIGRFMQVSECRWRITCRYQSLDETGNFPKFKLADGRHFENSFIAMSQPRIIRFRSNLVIRCKFPFRGRLSDKNRNSANSRWSTDAILKIVFSLYLGVILADQHEIWNRDEGSHAMPMYFHWPELQFSQTQDGGWPPFWK